LLHASPLPRAALLLRGAEAQFRSAPRRPLPNPRPPRTLPGMVGVAAAMPRGGLDGLLVGSRIAFASDDGVGSLISVKWRGMRCAIRYGGVGYKRACW